MTDSFYLQNEGIYTKYAHANIDFYWGPWTSVNNDQDNTSAFTNIPVGKRIKGLKFGVVNATTGDIEEYMFTKDNATDNDIVKLVLSSDDVAGAFVIDTTDGDFSALESAIEAGKIIIREDGDSKYLVSISATTNSNEYLLSYVDSSGMLHKIIANSSSYTETTESLVNYFDFTFDSSNSANTTTPADLKDAVDAGKLIRVNGYIATKAECFNNAGTTFVNLYYYDDEGKQHHIYKNATTQLGYREDIGGALSDAVTTEASSNTFSINNSDGDSVGTITFFTAASGAAVLTFADNNNGSFVATLPNLRYDSDNQMLKMVEADGTQTNLIKLSNLQIKTVFDYTTYAGSAPTSVDTGTYAIGDLALVEKQDTSTTSATVYYELAVVQSVTAGTPNDTIQWQEIGSINNVSLVAEAISYSGTVTGSTVKAAIDGLGGRMTSVENNVPNMADVYEDGLFIVDGNGNIGVKINESGLDAVVSPNLQNTIKGFVEGGDGQGSGDGTIIHVTPETKGWGINILIIGNSFSSDAAAYLPKLLEQSNVVEFNVGILYAANKNLFHHRNNLSGSSNDDYTYWEYSSDITDGGHWTQETNVKIWDGIGKRQWDIILTHELSNDSGDITHITNSLPQIVSYISNRIDYEAKYGYILTPAWGHSVSANSDTMWANINNVGKYIAKNYPQISLIVPIHTAMQNARTNNTLASYGADLNQGSSDKHSESGVGRFIQSYTLLLSLNELFKTEFPLVNTTWIPIYGTTVKGDGSGDVNIGTDGWFPRTNQFDYSIETGVIELIEKTVKAARDNMWRVSTIS